MAKAAGARLIQPEAEMVWPPVWLMLTRPEDQDHWPGAMNVIPWLTDLPTDRRDVNIYTVVMDEEDTFMAEFAISP
jgi:hypothetical protein